MKTALEIYAAYKIPQFLQLHQLRVTAVAKMVADACDARLDMRNIIIACLFHDMGNIIKSNFDLFPEAVEPEGRPYWERVKADFVRRYGSSAHHATIAICHELHLPLQAVRYIDGMGFEHLERTRDTPIFEQKIVEYADLRVAPHGIRSFNDRMEEARVRYRTVRAHIEGDDARFAALKESAFDIERQIFERTGIRPDQITEAAAEPMIAELRQFRVE